MKDEVSSRKHAKWLWLCFPLLIVIGVSAFVYLRENREYRDSDLGISIEVPRSWTVEKSERIASLYISPKKFGRDVKGSITIFSLGNYDDELLLALDRQVERIRQFPDEIVIIDEAEAFELNGYEAVRVRLLRIPQNDELEEDEMNGSYPFDLILVRGNHLKRVILLQVYKSPSNEEINAMLDEIVNSIQLMHDYDG